jgi:20S proteasome alpha/beta subunit
MHQFTLYSSVRPFGLNTIIASLNHDGGLYMVDQSGDFRGYKAIAIGKGKQVAKTELEKIDWTSRSCKDALKDVVRMYLTHSITLESMLYMMMPRTRNTNLNSLGLMIPVSSL